MALIEIFPEVIRRKDKAHEAIALIRRMPIRDKLKMQYIQEWALTVGYPTSAWLYKSVIKE